MLELSLSTPTLYFAATIGTLLLAHAIGLAALWLFAPALPGRRAELFVSLALGLTAFVTGYSLLKTHGVTINSGFVLTAGLMLAMTRRGPRRPFRELFRRQLALYPEALVVLTAFFLLRFLLVWNPAGGRMLFSPSLDVVIFSDLANFLNASGKENPQLDYLNARDLGVAVYHYYEIWVTASISGLTGLLTMYVDHLVTATLSGVVVYAGFAAMAERFKRARLPWLVLCFALAAFNAEALLPGFGRIKLLSHLEDFYGFSPIEYLKFFPVFMFLEATVLALLYGQRGLAAACLVAGSFSSFLAAPAIYGAAVLLILGGWLTGRLTRAELRQVTLTSLAGLVWLFAFYKVFQGASSFNRPPAIAESVAYYSHLKPWMTVLHIAIGTPLQLVAMLIPYLVVLLLARRQLAPIEQGSRDTLLLSVALLISGVACWSGLHFMYVAHELCTRNLHAAVNILVLLAALHVNEGPTRGLLKYATAGLLALLVPLKAQFYFQKWSGDRQVAAAAFDPAFLEEVARRLPGRHPLGAHFLGAGDYATSGHRLLNHRTGEFLGMIGDEYYPISLTVFDIPTDGAPLDHAAANAVHASSFFKFVEKQKLEKRFQDLGEAQVDFIHENQIDYAVLSKLAVLPGALRPFVRETLRDPRSGEQLVFF